MCGRDAGTVNVVPEIVVMVTEELTGPAVERWSRRFADAADVAPARLVADLTACPAVDAAAIDLLLRTHRQMVRADGRLLLRGAGGRVLRTLELARVGAVLECEQVVAP